MKEVFQVAKKYLSIHADRFYLFSAILFFAVWIMCKGPLRWFLKTSNPFLIYFMGVAPNFFAAIALVFWIVYITSSKVVVAMIYVVAILTASELIQFYVPGQTVDPADIVASVAGCIIAGLITILRQSGKFHFRA
ncbi:MAG: hypothetical protein EOP06_12570 [Proteobacteria bacterium]|nr:MAG: hypothetical protein EOP06_12570 [Pseudomonadota bacterium]